MQHFNNIKGVTEKDKWGARIMAAIMKIEQKHPELIKFLNEMPFTVPSVKRPAIKNRILKNILNRLNIYKMDTHSNSSLLNGENTGILLSHPRPAYNRPLDAKLLVFDLPVEVAKMKQECNWIDGKHNAITLMKSENITMVLIAMQQGHDMKLHQAKGPLIINIIEGKLMFTAEEEPVLLHKDQVLSLHENIKHELFAVEETIFLLTVVNLPVN